MYMDMQRASCLASLLASYMYDKMMIGTEVIGISGWEFGRFLGAVVGRGVCYFFHIAACQPPARHAASDLTPRRAMLRWNCAFVWILV